MRLAGELLEHPLGLGQRSPACRRSSRRARRRCRRRARADRRPAPRPSAPCRARARARAGPRWPSAGPPRRTSARERRTGSRAGRGSRAAAGSSTQAGAAATTCELTACEPSRSPPTATSSPIRRSSGSRQRPRPPPARRARPGRARRSRDSRSSLNRSPWPSWNSVVLSSAQSRRCSPRCGLCRVSCQPSSAAQSIEMRRVAQEDELAARPQQAGCLRDPLVGIAPDRGAVLGEREVEATRRAAARSPRSPRGAETRAPSRAAAAARSRAARG